MGSTSKVHEELSVPHVVGQCFLICLVFYLWTSPIIHPVKVMVVLFHEMSHGFMALLTGGKVLSIVITMDEGGACETAGGIAELIVTAGYLGSMFFGGILLYLSKHRGAVPVVYTLLTLTIATAIFTVLRDPFTRSFATALAASFICLGLLAPAFLGALVLRMLGTVSCLYSILDIYFDVLATSVSGYYIQNDAMAFSQLTGFSAKVVGGLWLAISVVYFAFILKMVAKERPTGSEAVGEAPAGAKV